MPRRPRSPAINQAVLDRVRAYLQGREDHPHPERPAGWRPQLQVINQAEADRAELRIYDAIGGWWGITAGDIAEALDDLGADQALTVRINSPGGDVFDGTAIYNLLRSRPGPTDVVVDGLAASAASFIAQAGDSITMNRGTQMMIHDAIGFTIGNAADHRQQVALLDRVSDEVAGIYQARAGDTVGEWRERMLAETWYNAAEAVEVGLADQTSDDDASDDDQDDAGDQAAAVANPGTMDLASHRTQERHD